MSPLLSQVVKYFFCHYNATVTNKIVTSAITTLLLLTVSTAAAFAQQLPQQQKKGLVVVSDNGFNFLEPIPTITLNWLSLLTIAY